MRARERPLRLTSGHFLVNGCLCGLRLVPRASRLSTCFARPRPIVLCVGVCMCRPNSSGKHKYVVSREGDTQGVNMRACVFWEHAKLYGYACIHYFTCTFWLHAYITLPTHYHHILAHTHTHIHTHTHAYTRSCPLR